MVTGKASLQHKVLLGYMVLIMGCLWHGFHLVI